MKKQILTLLVFIYKNWKIKNMFTGILLVLNVLVVVFLVLIRGLYRGSKSGWEHKQRNHPFGWFFLFFSGTSHSTLTMWHRAWTDRMRLLTDKKACRCRWQKKTSFSIWRNTERCDRFKGSNATMFLIGHRFEYRLSIINYSRYIFS